MIERIVPTMIKIFVGFIGTLILICVIIETNSIKKHSRKLMTDAREILRESCEYYMLESYRGSETFNLYKVGNSYDLYTEDGVMAISGTFYQPTEIETYKDLFDGRNGTTISQQEASEFIDWLDEEFSNKGFNKEDSMAYQIFRKVVKGEATEQEVSECITPANLGITYLDRKTLTKIFKWHLINYLTMQKYGTYRDKGVNEDKYKKRIHIYSTGEDDPNAYCTWNGFRVHFGSDDFNLELKPYLYDSEDSDDCDEFEDLTGIKLEDYRARNGIKSSDDIRRFVILYKLYYEIQLEYEGILPMWNIMQLFKGVQKASARGFGVGEEDEKIVEGEIFSVDREATKNIFGDKHNDTYLNHQEKSVTKINGSKWNNKTAGRVALSGTIRDPITEDIDDDGVLGARIRFYHID